MVEIEDWPFLPGDLTNDQIYAWDQDQEEEVFSDEVVEVGHYINDLLYESVWSERAIAEMAYIRFPDIEFHFTFCNDVDRYLNPNRCGGFWRNAYGYVNDGEPVPTPSWVEAVNDAGFDEDEGIEDPRFAVRCGVFTFGME
jgi:hypothetical protein